MSHSASKGVLRELLGDPHVLPLLAAGLAVRQDLQTWPTLSRVLVTCCIL